MKREKTTTGPLMLGFSKQDYNNPGLAHKFNSNLYIMKQIPVNSYCLQFGTCGRSKMTS